jgi:hypothetical protein
MSDEQAESEWRAYARKRMQQAAEKFLPTPEEHAAYQAEAAEAKRRADLFPELVVALKGYEQWEADMILSDKAWDGGMADLPTLTWPLWDRLLELQRLRNTILAKVQGA